MCVFRSCLFSSNEFTPIKSTSFTHQQHPLQGNSDIKHWTVVVTLNILSPHALFKLNTAKLSGIEATCIVIGDMQVTAPCKLTLSEATKILVVASERGYSNFVCMGFQIQLMKLSKC